MAGLRINLGFHTEISRFRDKRILKLGLFHLVMELFKWNETGYRVYTVHVERKTEWMFVIDCLAKKMSLHTEI